MITDRLRRHAPHDALRAELARAGIPSQVVHIVRSSQAITFVVGVQSRDVDALLSTRMAERLSHALAASHVRVSRDGGAVLVEMSLPSHERRPASVSTLRRGRGVPIGMDTLGRTVSLDLSRNETPHVLVCGTTGSGKSELLRTIVSGLDARLILIDGKGETFGDAGLTDSRQGAEALAWAVSEMSRRADGWTDRLVIVIDELQVILAETGGRDGTAAKNLARLTAQGRSRGVHVIVATQHATADVIGGSIAKANLPCRITGRVTDAAASVLATGQRGLDAHRLSGAGDMLLVAGGRVRRLQVALAGAVDYERVCEPQLSDDRKAVFHVEAAPVHPTQQPTIVTDSETQWAIDNRQGGMVAGILAIRRRFGCGELRARRIQTAASQVSHPSQASRPVSSALLSPDPDAWGAGGRIPARVALALEA